MKIRASFVSNSSSSSFIIGTPKPLDKETLIKLLWVSKDSILHPLVDDVADLFLQEAVPYTEQTYLENNFCTDNVPPENVKKILDKNWNLYCGSFSSSSDNAIERALTYQGFKIDSEDIFISKEHGY